MRKPNHDDETSAEETDAFKLDAHGVTIDPTQLKQAGRQLTGHRTNDSRIRNTLTWILRSSTRRGITSGLLGLLIALVAVIGAERFFPGRYPLAFSGGAIPMSYEIQLSVTVFITSIILFGPTWLLLSLIVNLKPYDTQGGDRATLLLGSARTGKLTARYERKNGSNETIKRALEEVHTDAIPLHNTDDSTEEFINEYLPEAEGSLYGMECSITEKKPRDTLTKGEPAKELLAGENDRGLPIDNVAGVLASGDFSAVVQVTFAPRNKSDIVYENHKTRVESGADQWLPIRTIGLLLEDESDSDSDGDNHPRNPQRLESIKELNGSSLFDINIRVVLTADDEAQAERTFEQITTMIDAASSERYQIGRVDSIDTGWLSWGDVDADTVRERMYNHELITNHRYYVPLQRKRTNLTVDNETIWNFILLPGKGNRDTQRGLNTTSRAQVPTDRPTDTQMDALRAEPADDTPQDTASTASDDEEQNAAGADTDTSPQRSDEE